MPHTIAKTCQHCGPKKGYCSSSGTEPYGGIASHSVIVIFMEQTEGHVVPGDAMDMFGLAP